MRPTPPPADPTGALASDRDGVLVAGSDWRIALANPSLHEILDLAAGAADGAALWDLFPAWNDGPEGEILRRAMADREGARVRWTDAAGRAWDVEAEPREDGGLRIRLRNATAEALEERLRNAERASASVLGLLDALAVGVAVVDARTREITYTNAAAAAFGGRQTTPDGEPAAPRWEIFRPTGEPLPADETVSARVLATGAPVDEAEVVLRSPLGEERVILASGVPVRDGEGRVTHAAVSFVDVTERQRLEGELVRRSRELEGAVAEAAMRAEENRALLAAAEALTSTLDPGEVMARIVGIAADLLRADGAGLSVLLDGDSFSLPVAVGCLEAFRHPGMPRRGSLTERVLAAGGPLLLDGDDVGESSDAARLFTRLGMTQYALVPLRAEGETFGVLGVVNRRTSRRLTGDDLRLLSLLGDQAALAVRNARAHEAAQAASRAKSRFLAVMSHELRTPLNALAGYASLMTDGIYGPVSDAQRTALERMESARKHLLGLIDQVLELARSDGEEHPLAPAEVDVAALAREVGEGVRGAAAAKQLALIVSADGTLKVRTDGRLLRQVLGNLMGNAVKFTETGGVELRVQQVGDELLAEVEDTGPGIADDLSERIFEPFFQADTSPTRRQGGTGLGLAVAREFARLLGGDVTVRSDPGHGSVFTVRIPAPAEVEAEAAADESPGDAEAAGESESMGEMEPKREVATAGDGTASMATS